MPQSALPHNVTPLPSLEGLSFPICLLRLIMLGDQPRRSNLPKIPRWSEAWPSSCSFLIPVSLIKSPAVILAFEAPLHPPCQRGPLASGTLLEAKYEILSYPGCSFPELRHGRRGCPLPRVVSCSLCLHYSMYCVASCPARPRPRKGMGCPKRSLRSHPTPKYSLC